MADLLGNGRLKQANTYFKYVHSTVLDITHSFSFLLIPSIDPSSQRTELNHPSRPTPMPFGPSAPVMLPSGHGTRNHQ